MPRRSVTAGDDDDEAIVARTIPREREREMVDSRFSLSSLECVFGFRGRDAARARCATSQQEAEKRRRLSVFSHYSARRRFGLCKKKFNNFT